MEDSGTHLVVGVSKPTSGDIPMIAFNLTDTQASHSIRYSPWMLY
jgi:hypothetical protein